MLAGSRAGCNAVRRYGGRQSRGGDLFPCGPGKGAIGLCQKTVQRHQRRIVPRCGASAAANGNCGKKAKPCRSALDTSGQTQVIVPAMQTRRRRAKVTMVWVKVWSDSPGPALNTPMSKRGW